MLYIDCGHTVAGTHYTGIQRYVRRTLRHAQALLGPGQVAGLSAGGGSWACLPALPAHPLEGLPALPLAAGAPRLDRRSHVLLADRFWHTGAWDALDTLVDSPARITLVVYDLLSLRQPQWFAAGVGERFRRYLLRVLPRADLVVCLSGVVAAELDAWMRAEGVATPPVQVVAPGHVVWDGAPVAPPLPQAWAGGQTPFVLQVGTLEPRKNHMLTLAALLRQWDAGLDLGCLFIGQRGWLMDDVAVALRQLPQWRRQLVWLEECTDAQLAWCYRHARAVLYPSAAEGYGLPLAEAAAAGAAVVATDTAVHREVVRQLGSQADGVRLTAASHLAVGDALAAVLSAPPRAHQSHRGRSWQDATRSLLAAMGLAPSAALRAWDPA